jgi:hypothetical protein
MRGKLVIRLIMNVTTDMALAHTGRLGVISITVARANAENP